MNQDNEAGMIFSREELKKEAERLHESLKHLKYSLNECMVFAPLTLEINRLKKEKNAIVLAHNYQRAEILFGIADYYGDSLGLAKKAKESNADIIVFCGVKFMAETAKILNPEKKVLLPDLNAGCSLSEGITAEDVRKLRAKYPGIPVVTYINTSAEVKAESDVIVTSANALKIIEALPSKEVIFLPDVFMAENIQAQTSKKIIRWQAVCIVHESFTKQQVIGIKKEHPDIKIFAHYECRPEVVALSDKVGSTSQMEKFIEENPETKKFMLITECGMNDLVRIKHSDKEFIVPCAMCPFMKKIHLENTLETLKSEENKIEIPEKTRLKAEKALKKMLEMS